MSNNIVAKSVDRAFVGRIRPGIAALELEGEAVVYDDVTGGVHHLNRTATMVWNSFDGCGTLEQLAAHLAARSGADNEVVCQEIVALSQSFVRQGLVEGVIPPVGQGDASIVFQPGELTERVVVMGQGYVGLPLAMRAVQAGHNVVGYEVDLVRVKRLVSGDSYVEDISDEELAGALASGRYVATADIEACAGFDVAVITVPTPLREGVPDLSFIEESGRMLAAHIRPGACVVLESTTYPGTTEELLAPILENGSGLVAGTDFALGYSPERIDPGNPTWNLTTTPKVVSGLNDWSLSRVQHFYDSIVERTVPVSGTREAELTKLLENTFRHVNIALLNEMAMFAHDLGIDIWEAIDAASTKPFGYLRFTPGPGVGGHCLPIDPSYLSWRVRRRLGHSFRFVELANDVNDHMPDYVVHRVTVALNRDARPVKGSRILILGLAYKRNTSDARESPALVVVERLRHLGAVVVVADPYVPEELVDIAAERVDPTTAEVEAADCVVILTDHDVFDYDMIVQHARFILDTRHRVVGAQVEYL